jgi:ferritin-like metal-binding protein YciE
MDTEKLNDLFNRELEETYLAEKLLLDLLSNPAARSTAQAASVEVGLGQAQERARQLERIFALTKDTAVVAKRSAPAVLHSIIAVIEDREAGEAANLAALRTFRHHLEASYAKLTLWATLLRKPELAKILNATLAEEKAALLTSNNVFESGQTKEPKSSSLGERLTAMFDRKR